MAMTGTPRVQVQAACGFVVCVVVIAFLGACGSGRTEPQKDISGRLATVAAAGGSPSYFLGGSFAGVDLTMVEAARYEGSFRGEGAYFEYGTCEYQPDSGCSPPIQVQNNTAKLRGNVVGCRRLTDIRGVPAIAWGGGLTVFTATGSVTIFAGDDPPVASLRTMAEALRPVSATADATQPLPSPPPDVLASIAEHCRAAPRAFE
jgi:hypothetical protein